MPSFPTFVINGKGDRRGIDWGFNTWGGEVDGLYPSWENDNRVARKFCNLLGNDVYDKRDFICEGSSIHADGENDPQYALSKASLDALEAATDAKGRRIRVYKLPLPKPVTITAEECDGLDLCDGEPTRTPGERLAASYVNFYIANEAVVMPAFGDPMDEKAQAILQELFPTRKVVAIPARDILIGGGNIHCVTQQIPKI